MTKTYSYKGFRIQYCPCAAGKIRWQVVDPQYYGFVVYADRTLKDCKDWCDSEV